MEKENIARFLDASMTDKALAAKLAALAAEYGYDFTAEELLEFGSARPLTDAETDHVSGGTLGYIGRCRKCGAPTKPVLTIHGMDSMSFCTNKNCSNYWGNCTDLLKRR